MKVAPRHRDNEARTSRAKLRRNRTRLCHMFMRMTRSTFGVTLSHGRGLEAIHERWLKMNALDTNLLQTDRPEELVCLQRPSWVRGVSFWSVAESKRLWTMHHDTFTASVPLGPWPELRAVWSSRGAERLASPGCVQLMEPGETHRTLSVSTPASFFVCWWTPEALSNAARGFGLRGGNLHFKLPQLEASPVAQAMTRLHSALQRNASPLELDQHLLEATELLLEHAAEQPLVRPRWGRHHPSVRRALDVLHGSFASSLSLSDLARESRISKFHLARCFRETTGMAPHQYQKLLRLQAGRRLLEAGESVRVAAERTGFADAPHFTRAFSSWLGVSPGKWASAHA